MDNFGSLAIGVGTLAIVLVVAFMILAQGRSTTVSLITATSYQANKTLTNNTIVTFNECIADEDIIVTGVSNGTADQVTLSSGNYTIQRNTINVTCIDSQCSAIKEVNYSCRLPTVAYNSTTSLQTATSTIPGWVSIIIITALGAALIGMVAMFRR